MGGHLCPKCGAYWRCDCSIEDLIFVPLHTCEHDWVEAVGVEVDADLASEGHGVRVCRLCGVYDIAYHAASSWNGTKGN